MGTIELSKRASPAPTYSSTFHSDDWTHSHIDNGDMSNNPYFHRHPTGASFAQSTSKKAMPGPEENVKPDYQDSSHPHYAGKSVQHAEQYPLRPRQPSRWPRKRVLVPCVLGGLLLLILLWLGSIAVGVKTFFLLHPPLLPEVHEIHIHLQDDSTQITTITPSPSQTVPTVRVTVQPTLQFSAPVRPTLDPDSESNNRAPSGIPQSDGIPNLPTTTFVSLQRGGVIRPSGFTTHVKRDEHN